MQILLPIVPADGLIINRMLSVVKRTEGEKTIWAYFYGAGLVFEHDSDDLSPDHNAALPMRRPEWAWAASVRRRGSPPPPGR